MVLWPEEGVVSWSGTRIYISHIGKSNAFLDKTLKIQAIETKIENGIVSTKKVLHRKGNNQSEKATVCLGLDIQNV